MLTRKAESIWSALNGVICVYKPSHTTCAYLIHKLKTVICDDLNKLDTKPPKNYLEVNRTDEGISLNVRPSYADHVLVAGPRFQPHMINITFVSYLSKIMSGVLIVGINDGSRIINGLKKCFLTKCFHVKGILGQATEHFYIDDKVLARAKYDHVTQYYVDRILASYQGVNQRRIFEDYALNITSEEAYKLAVSGMYRPNMKGGAITYSLKSLLVDPPNITLEIQCVNENEAYLKNLIHNLGVSMKCFATCSEIRCIRQGCFNLDYAMLRKHWNLNNILENMKLCHKVLVKNFPETIEYTPIVSTAEKVNQ